MSFDAKIRVEPATDSLRRIFGDSLPLLSCLPIMAEGPDGVAEFYKLDVAAISSEQRARLVEELASRFHSPANLIAHLVDDPNHGVPILAAHLVVPMDLRFFT